MFLRFAVCCCLLSAYMSKLASYLQEPSGAAITFSVKVAAEVIMRLLGKIFLLFTISTLVELFLLVQLTWYTSIWITVAMVLATAMLGSYLLKREGTRALSQVVKVARFQAEPTTVIIDSMLVLLGAAFLITPGILTDLAGIMLMFSQLRCPLVKLIERKLWRALDKHTVGSVFVPRGDSEIIDVEVER